MYQSVCLYSELEPYSGSISRHLSDLPRLIRDLKWACLFYDVVVIHRRNLFEHPLTLPAFERLAPFVQSGQLWISANESDRLPKDYVTQKVQQLKTFFVSNRGSINIKNTKNRKNAVNNIKERWQRICPAEWKIQRCGSIQAASVLTNIDGYLSQFKDNKFRLAYPLLDLVQSLRADNDFDKELILAKVGTLRGLLHSALLSKTATLIQTEFVRAGAEFNHHAVIYPGQSAQYLTNTHFGRLPFADQKTLHQAKERLNSVSLNLDQLLDLPVEALFEIAQSEPWQTIRKASLNDIFDAEIQQQMRSAFSTDLSFLKKLLEKLNRTGHFQPVENPYPQLSDIFMPSRWALASQSLLGNASVVASVEVKTVSKTFILDLDSRVLYNKNSPSSQVELSLKETELLSNLVEAGESGLTFEHLKQLQLEFDLITRQIPKWESQVDQRAEYDDALLARNYKFKTNLNKKLKPLGLKIAAKRDPKKWYLETGNSDQDFIIKLSGTVWGKIFEKKEMKEPPQGLSPQSKEIWHCLWEYYPGFVSAKVIAEVFGKEWNEKTPTQIADAIYKLKKSLTNEPWKIRHSYSTGEYALVPRSLSDNSSQ